MWRWYSNKVIQHDIYYLANVDSGNTPGRLKVHVDKKLDNNNVQLQTIYVMVNSRTFKDLCNEI